MIYLHIISLDNYNELVDLWEHIQNTRNNLELVIQDNYIICKILPLTFKGSVKAWYKNLKSNSITIFRYFCVKLLLRFNINILTKKMNYPYEDTMVISTLLDNRKIYRVLVGNDNFINILSKEMMSYLRIYPSILTMMKTYYWYCKVKGVILVKGALKLTVIIGTHHKHVTFK